MGMAFRRILMGGVPNPPPKWALGYTGTFPNRKPVVYRKSRGSWAQVYDGASAYDANHDVIFTAGVRNPADAKGVISVRVSERRPDGPAGHFQDGLAGSNDPIFAHPKAGGNWPPPFDDYVIPTCIARSVDGGQTWSPVAIDGIYEWTDGLSGDGSVGYGEALIARDPASPDSPSGSASILSPSPRIVGNFLCSPSEGVLVSIGLKRSSIGATIDHGTYVTEYYDTDLGLLVSVDGGPFAFTSGVPWLEWYQTSPVSSPLTHIRGFVTADAAGGFAGQRIQQDTAPAPLFLGPLFDYTNDTLAPGFHSYLATINGTALSLTAAPALSTDYTCGRFWDGQELVMAGAAAGGVALRVVKSLDGFSFSTVYTSSSVNAPPGPTYGAARSAEKWVVDGLGATADAGHTFGSPSGYQKVDVVGRSYYGVDDNIIYRSRDGVTWDTEYTAPSGVVFLDIFGA